MSSKQRFTVLGKPFFSIGGQTHNSSSYFPDDMERSFSSVRALGGNTVATPICWNAFEPEEGLFNEDYVRAIINNARHWKMHLTLLWFATWKNGTMEYAPHWVKTDTKRFARTLCKDGSATAVLSCHCEYTRKADETAFCRLMQVVRDYDATIGTVIGIQIENEPGILGATRRDFGPEGERDFAAQVPAQLIEYAKQNPDCRLNDLWRQAGGREVGCWADVFGRYGAEACTAWHIARYIDSIAKAGKEIYDIFLYANVWLDGGVAGNGWGLGGLEYPCGGAVTKSLDVWYAACENLDAIAPDNYQQEPLRYLEVSQTYAHSEKGWPLYVPESHAGALNATLMFEAIANHGAIGYHIFGCEGCLNDEGKLTENAEMIARSFAMLSAVSHLITQSGDKRKMHALWQRPGETAKTLSLCDWNCRVSFMGSGHGWNGSDFRHSNSARAETRGVTDLCDETARGLLFEVGENEFYLVGHNLRLAFLRHEPMDGSIPPNWMSSMHLVNSVMTRVVEEGRFVDGKFVAERRRSGDEACHGIWAQYDCGVIHFILMD